MEIIRIVSAVSVSMHRKNTGGFASSPPAGVFIDGFYKKPTVIVGNVLN